MKKKSKLILIILIIFMIIIAGIGIYFIMKDRNKPESNETLLQNIGYSKEEIKIIVKDKKHLNYALNNDYIAKYTELISAEDFKMEFLGAYISYLNENIEAPINDTIYLVNNDKYYAYNPKLIEFLKAKYFLETRLDRYIAYQASNPTLNVNEIIKRVNSDIDFGFYNGIVDSNQSLGYLLICNKHYKLSSSYAGNLVTIGSAYTRVGGALLDSVAYEAFKKLSDTARSQGLNIVNQSAYRSYSTQQYIYNDYLNRNGRTWTDRWSARPGHSEHQTGFALDVATYTTKDLGDFEFTNEFKWMQENAHKYGFILRYPNGQDYITGYGYEPWHYRYVGVDAATAIHNENITFEEYYAYYILKK